jgi:DNA-directed RNA polymerase subunit RPC12/RpoP
MSDVSYRCVCGATLRYKQDLRREAGGVYPTYKCRECGTQVPGRTAEQLWHQHPS